AWAMSSAKAPEPVPPAAASWSLAARLTAWYAGTAFLLVLLATGFLYWVLASNLDREDDELLADKAEVVRLVLAERPDGARALRDDLERERAANPRTRFLVRVLDAGGRTVLESAGMGGVLPPEAFPGAAAGELPPGAELRSAAGQSFRVLAARAPGHVLQVA